MQPLETKGKAFIEVTLRLWPSHSVCVYLNIICMCARTCRAQFVHLPSHFFISCRSPHSQRGRRKWIYRGIVSFKEFSLSLSVIIHTHINTVVSSKQVTKKLHLIWRENLASLIGRLEGCSSKLELTGFSCPQRGVMERQEQRCFSAR